NAAARNANAVIANGRRSEAMSRPLPRPAARDQKAAGEVVDLEGMTSAMVLSAGFGTRLRPLTDELAKPLMPVGDRPMLAHVIDALSRGGVEDVVVNTHHRGGDFVPQIERLGLAIHVVHESKILGTAGGVANASRTLGTGDVVVWN